MSMRIGRPQLIAGALMSTVVVVAVVVATNWKVVQRWFDLETVPWTTQVQTILQAFPELLPDRKHGEGWEAGYHCGGPENSVWPEIACGKENFDPYLTIMDLGNYDSVLNHLESVPTLSLDRPVTHPSFSDPLAGSSTLRVRNTASVYVRFPADSAKSRFLLRVFWRGHSEDEIFDRWLPELPISP